MTERYPPDATPFNAPVSVELAPGEKVSVVYSPTRSGTTFYLPILAASKYRGLTYEARADGQVIFEESEIPPTDIDDLHKVFYPPETFDTELVVMIRNPSQATKDITIQPIGWETEEDA